MALSDAATITMVRGLFPYLTTSVASDVYLTAWLPWARSLVGVESWIASYDMGVSLLLAHLAIRSPETGDPSGPQGPLTAIATLAMSASFGAGVPADSDALDIWLSSGSTAGPAFLAIRNSLPDYALPDLFDMGYP